MNKAFEFASWLFLASIMNLIVPRLLPYFTLERIWKHCRDMLYLFIVWLLYRFVWFPVNRMLAFIRKSCHASARMSGTCDYIPMVSVALAMCCFVASLYYTGHLSWLRGKTPTIATDDASNDDSQDLGNDGPGSLPVLRPQSSRVPRSRRTSRQRSGYVY